MPAEEALKASYLESLSHLIECHLFWFLLLQEPSGLATWMQIVQAGVSCEWVSEEHLLENIWEVQHTTACINRHSPIFTQDCNSCLSARSLISYIMCININIIHQIFSLECDWSKHVTRLNIPQFSKPRMLGKTFEG